MSLINTPYWNKLRSSKDYKPLLDKVITNTISKKDKEIALRCPTCKSYLVGRKNKINGNSFYGCASFPKCRYVAKTLEKGKTLSQINEAKRIAHKKQNRAIRKKAKRLAKQEKKQ